MKNYTCCLLLALVSLASCTMSRQTLLVPCQPVASFTENNIAYTRLQQDSLELIAGYYRTQGEYLVMDVEIGNMTNDSITFDPALCSYALLDSLSGLPAQVKEEGVLKTIYETAIVPEQELKQIDEKIRRKEAAMRTKTVLLTVLAVAVTIVTVAAVVKNSSSKKNDFRSSSQRAVANNNLVWLWSDSMRLIGSASADTHERFKFDAANLYDLRETWENMPLRTITIPPKQRIRGDVVFHPHALNGKLSFAFPVGKYQFDILFEQTIKHH